MPDVRTVSRRSLLSALICVPWLRPTAGRAQVRRLPPIERILVIKHERRLYALAHGDVVASFRVALGRRPYGHKLREGDGRTPEGLYFVDGFVPDSEFYRAIKISYPNREDRARARKLGVNPGGRIMIHGLDPAIPPEFRDSHWLFNWTNGCIAVRNEEMDMLWERVTWGTPVEIRA